MTGLGADALESDVGQPGGRAQEVAPFSLAGDDWSEGHHDVEVMGAYAVSRGRRALASPKTTTTSPASSRRSDWTSRAMSKNSTTFGRTARFAIRLPLVTYGETTWVAPAR